jgi:hypothetical protein
MGINKNQADSLLQHMQHCNQQPDSPFHDLGRVIGTHGSIFKPADYSPIAILNLEQFDKFMDVARRAGATESQLIEEKIISSVEGIGAEVNMKKIFGSSVQQQPNVQTRQ